MADLSGITEITDPYMKVTTTSSATYSEHLLCQCKSCLIQAMLADFALTQIQEYPGDVLRHFNGATLTSCSGMVIKADSSKLLNSSLYLCSKTSKSIKSVGVYLI